MKNTLELIGDVLFPKTCLSCGRLGSYICISCARRLPFISRDICPYCRKASFMGLTHPACKRTHGVDGLLSFFYYNNQTQKIIKAVKYRLVRRALQEFLSLIPADRIPLVDRYKLSSALGIAVPLHPSRARSRGFNQAELITEFFYSHTTIARANGVVRRRKDTASQARIMSHKTRYDNLRGAFVLSESTREIVGNTFVVFDDVWTSGATIKELTRVLKRGGAGQVFAVTVAR